MKLRSLRKRTSSLQESVMTQDQDVRVHPPSNPNQGLPVPMMPTVSQLEGKDDNDA